MRFIILRPVNFYKKCFLSFWILFFVAFTFLPASAQLLKVTGNLVDKKDNAPMIGVGVVLINSLDTLKKISTATDVDGNFTFRNLNTGTYKLSTIYLGYNPVRQDVVISNEDVNTGSLKMEESSILLKDVNIQSTQIRTEQKGDTTQYNANAFKVNKDATVEDLVGKMPGITSDNGTIKAQGENVKKVLVDGKEFFGSDATLALRNLPAEVVDKIQVFDRMSEQARFTGVDDGNSEKTINIITKAGKSNGLFGKVFGGYATNEKYATGGNLNYFKGDRRISLVGLSNNINQQNFSSQDLLGISGTNNAPGGGGRGGGGGGGFGGGGGGQGNASNNFLVGQQGGINTTHSLGLNYSDKWGKKINITGSYFFNKTDNINDKATERNYFQRGNHSQFYNENSINRSSNLNHRTNIRLEYTIDSLNSIVLTPTFSLQDNRSETSLIGNTKQDSTLINRTTNNNASTNVGYNFSNNLLFRHKFRKVGRTLSLNLGTTINNQYAYTNQYSLNQFFALTDTNNVVVDQRTHNPTKGYTLSSDLIYTEPIHKNGLLQFNYSPSYTRNNNLKETLIPDANGNYAIKDTLLSSNFDNKLITQRGGISYRLRTDKLNFSVGINYQNVVLTGEQLSPERPPIQKVFNNPLPNAMLMYKFSKNSNLRVFYRTSTNAPSINQLQNVVNNSNPLLLSTGNPDLKQQYMHTFVARYNLTTPEKGRTLVAFFNVVYTGNYIGSSTYIARTDTTIDNGINLYRGSKLTRPVNLEGNWNAQSLITYGLPLNFIKCNLNLNLGGGYQRIPGLVNNITNYSETYNVNGGFVLGSNISEKLDFKLSYTPTYNIVKNTIQASSNNNYLVQNTSLKANWQLWKGLVLGSDITRYQYTGLGAFNQDIFLWSASVAYKFLKKEQAEFKLTAFDLLNQNNSINRSITETYIETNQTQVIRQYFMLTFTYTFRNFIDSAPKN